MIIRRYSQLRRYDTFEDRFEYLKLGGEVGAITFGHDRHLNQNFYRSYEWRRIRNIVIDRDRGCDLGIPGREIHEGLLIHHINPMTADDILHEETWIVDPEYLITTCHDTHNAIHYGDASLLKKDFEPRRPGDTKLW
ncbi:hypothetical protein KC887_07260 [Candidatus Kaiserbacteria bacterium]|nr:hypothetical protein [Candidatus Kaiserbacteria bacterium]